MALIYSYIYLSYWYADLFVSFCKDATNDFFLSPPVDALLFFTTNTALFCVYSNISASSISSYGDTPFLFFSPPGATLFFFFLTDGVLFFVYSITYAFFISSPGAKLCSRLLKAAFPLITSSDGSPEAVPTQLPPPLLPNVSLRQTYPPLSHT